MGLESTTFWMASRGWIADFPFAPRPRGKQIWPYVLLSGGGQRLAQEISVPLLGSVPLQPQLAALADEGQPILIAQPESPAAQSLRDIAEQLQRKTAGRSMALPIMRG